MVFPLPRAYKEQQKRILAQVLVVGAYSMCLPVRAGVTRQKRMNEVRLKLCRLKDPPRGVHKGRMRKGWERKK